MQKKEIPVEFLHTIDKCYFCESTEAQARLRTYFKFRTTITESTPFAKPTKFQKEDPRFNDEFIMCDNCRVYWNQTEESKQAFKYYKKIYQENRFKSEEVRKRHSELNSKSYKKRKGIIE